MTLNQARNVFGLGPDEDPRPHLAEFRLARERIAEWVRTAPDEIIADRYQQGLVEFDQALAAILESLEEPEPALSPPAAPAVKVAAAPPATVAIGRVPVVARAAVPRRRSLAWVAWLLVILAAAGGAGLYYHKFEQDKVLQRQARLAFLEREGSVFVENRRWQEAAMAFAEIEELAPGSELAMLGRRSIESGMAEEQTQFVGYWTGQAIAELDSGRLDEAQAAIRRVIEKFPAEKESLAIMARITAARVGQAREAAIGTARKQLEDRQWDAAIAGCRKILATTPDDADAQAILADATAGLAKFTADQARAKELLDRAAARDQGQFDAEALECLREAAALAPDNQEIAARLEKMASYTRTLRVPGDFATPEEALAVAHDRDRIVLSEQTWKGQLVVNAAIELQGAGSGKTIVTCPATAGCPIMIGPAAKGARISGITFRHDAFHALGNDRFSAALVSGGSATFVDCHFSDASGHGLVVIDQGAATATRCRFADNGWNGASAIGKGSALEVSDSEALNNFGHGIESWDGAAVNLSNNRCEGNCRNGIHVDNGSAPATIVANQLIANREFGLVLDSAGAGKITDNTARANLLGGLVIRKSAAALVVTGNQSTLNQGPGMVLEKGLSQASYTSNSATKNTPQQILADADLSQQQESQEVDAGRKAPLKATAP
jgi:tetratricopeptide (TPR) repeat protein